MSTSQLIEGLRNEENFAVQYILEKAEYPFRKAIQSLSLTNDKIMEILYDGLLIFIRKIQEGVYDHSQSLPSTYYIGICKNLALNETRAKKQIIALPIDDSINYIKDDTHSYTDQLEFNKLLSKMLLELGSPCHEIIKYKYIEGYSDAEQIKLGLMAYSSIASLKVSRGNCLKKLSALSHKYKTQYEGL